MDLKKLIFFKISLQCSYCEDLITNKMSIKDLIEIKKAYIANFQGNKSIFAFFILNILIFCYLFLARTD